MLHRSSVIACALGASLTLVLGVLSAEAQEFPAVEVDPPSGPVGTFIEFTGPGFDDPSWSLSGAHVWFIRDIGDECELVVELDNAHFELTDDGILSGSGNVGTTGSCKQSDGTPQPVPHGTYAMSYHCYACTVGEFTVTAPTTPTNPTSLPHTGTREARLSAIIRLGAAFVLVGGAILVVTRRLESRQ